MKNQQSPTILIYDEKRPTNYITGWREIKKHYPVVLLSKNNLSLAKNIVSKIDILTRIIIKYKVKLIHIHEITFSNLVPLYLVARKLEIPIVATLHSYKLVCPLLDYVRYPEFIPCSTPYPNMHCMSCVISYYKAKHDKIFNSLFKLGGLEMLRWIYEDFDIVITPSRLLADIMKSIGFNNIIVIRNPLNPLFEPFRDKEVDADQGEYVGFIGRLEYLKGVPIVLAIAKRLADKKIKFVIAGEGTYRKLVKQYTLTSKNLSYRGFISGIELIEFYKQARIIIVPSIAHECLPGVVIEALTMGKPVIGFALGGVKELLEESKGGILIKPFDIEKMTSSIESIIFDDQLRRELSINGKKWIINTIPTVKHYSEKLINLYRQIL